MAAFITADDFSSGIDTTGSLNVGGSTNGNIEKVGDTDWFSIMLVSGKNYTVSCLGKGLGDPMLKIYSNFGSIIKSDDDSAGSFNSQISFTPSMSGKYFIEVLYSTSKYAYGSSTGNYLVKADITAGKTFQGTSGGDVLIGTAGNDILIGGGGHDTLNGGDGDDTYYISSLYNCKNRIAWRVSFI